MSLPTASCTISSRRGRGPPCRAARPARSRPSVAFVVSSWLGLDTGDYSFGYVAGWGEGKNLSELRASLDEIRGAALGIIGGMEQKMAENRETEGLERVRAIEHEPDAACGNCPSARPSPGGRPPATTARRASPTGPIGERRGAAS